MTTLFTYFGVLLAPVVIGWYTSEMKMGLFVGLILLIFVGFTSGNAVMLAFAVMATTAIAVLAGRPVARNLTGGES